jgi:hypothetical protein
VDQQDLRLREAEATAILVGMGMDTNSDDEDYMETPSPEPEPGNFREYWQMQKSLFEIRADMMTFMREKARRNDQMSEMHASILATQTRMMDQMNVDRANWNYKIGYLFKCTGLQAPPDRLPTNHLLCATPSHRLPQGLISQVQQADRQVVNRIASDGQLDTGSKAQQGMQTGDQNAGSRE